MLPTITDILTNFPQIRIGKIKIKRKTFVTTAALKLVQDDLSADIALLSFRLFVL